MISRKLKSRPRDGVTQTLSSLTALVCVVSILFVASYMIAMNHYAVMMVYFCNQYNVGGGIIWVFLNVPYLFIYHFCTWKESRLFTTNSVLYCSSMLTTAPILWPKLHATCKLVYFKRFLRQGLREREMAFWKSTPAVPDHHVTIPALFVHVATVLVASNLMHQKFPVPM